MQRRSLWILLLLTSLLAAFAFQGRRGLWEPDEGRYADAAMTMLEDGDAVVPKLHDLPYLDKPPMVYWSIAAGLQVFGRSEAAARAGHGFALLATIWLVAWMAHSMWGGDAGPLAGIAYSACLFPVTAANILTPDTLLAACTTATTAGYWFWFRRRECRRCWLGAALFGSGLALGILTKGPASLMFAAPLALHGVFFVGPLRLLGRLELWLVTLCALAAGGSWYWLVLIRFPDAASYLVDNQVVGRLVHSGYDRNANWWDAFTVYLPILSLGLLPLPFFWPWRRLVALRLRGIEWRKRMADPGAVFLALAVTVPLVVLLCASSRLPLYALPLCAPIVVATAPSLRASVEKIGLLVASTALLLALRWFGGSWHSEKDTRALAEDLQRLGVDGSRRILVIDQKRHALPFYGYEDIEWVEMHPYPYFASPPDLEDLRDREPLRRDEPPIALARWNISGILVESGLACSELSRPDGAVEETRVWDCVDRIPPPESSRPAVGAAAVPAGS